MRRLIFILLAMIGVSHAQTIQYIGAPTTTVISRGNFRTDSIFYLPKRSKAPTDTAAFRYQISDSSLYVWTGSQWIKAGGSGTITGSGITGYLPQFSASTTLDTSALFTLGNRLGIGSSTFAYTSTNTANVELNGTAGGILGFKRNDSARGYLWHTGDNMELANTVAGSISFNTNSATRGSISSAGVWRLNNLAGTGDRVVQASSNGTLSASTSVTGLVDTTTISTRAWRQKGLDSLAALEVSGSGTTNYIPKFTAGSTIGNSQIFDNGTNVGIGTASPLVKLDIVSSAGTVVRTKGGTGSAQGSAYYVQAAGSSNTLSAFGDRANIFGGTVDQIASIYTGSGIPLTFDVGNTERLRITSGGDVGISQPSLLWTATNRRLLELNGTSQSLIGLNVNSLKAGYIWQNGNDMTIATENAGYIQFGTNGASDRMRIFSTGRIGINTTTDAGYQLDVNGDVRFQGTLFTRPGTNTGIVMANTSAIRNTGTQYFDYGTGGSGEFYFRGGSGFSNVMTLMNGGNVGVNTASPVIPFQLNNYGGIDGNGNQFIIRNNIYYNNTNARSEPIKTGFQTMIEMNNNDGTMRFSTSSASNTVGTAASITERMRIFNNGRVFVGSSPADAGFQLDVNGNTRVTGKIDVTSNTTFGLGVARSGTSESAGQIFNSNGILYFGTESSAGGQIFSGSSAYAAVIGSGANYPLQFATNNITRATMTTSGNLLLGFTTDSYFLKLQVNGSVFSNNQILAQGVNAQIAADSSANISPLYISNQSLTGTSAQGLLYGSTTWNTTGNPSLIDLNITNTASGATSNYIKISDGSNIFRVTKAAEVVTAAPTGGSIRKWKLGEAATVSPTSPNRTIRVEIDGVVYYLHAKTTND